MITEQDLKPGNVLTYNMYTNKFRYRIYEVKKDFRGNTNILFKCMDDNTEEFWYLMKTDFYKFWFVAYSPDHKPFTDSEYEELLV